ncbi:hypothetical protein [Thermospira aquatica]|uniref:Yip1 domain-containing protein n=1 Tax=Thermospira aquatica TaxID=2828656 RepID=A0AAX3BAB1_9SPIR|nr:hypothetical protein [Thermospira aquatica]URA09186.1 hypothetical protein KDW03_06655 [Thermospira aquatica]
MRDILFRIGIWWWRPSVGAKEAIMYHPRWSEIVWLIVMNMVAMGIMTLLAIGGSFRSLVETLGGIVLFSLSFVVWWVVVFAVMMMLLVAGFRRVVVPERLLFLLGVSHLSWVFLLPVALVGVWIGTGFVTFVSFVAGLLSFLWLVEVFRKEYALSFAKTLVIVVFPAFIIFLQGIFWALRTLVTLVLMGSL